MKTALLIGSGDMAVLCAAALLEYGFDLVGLNSPDAPLREWAEHAGIAFFDTFDKFELRARTIEADFLFSALNFRILSDLIIKAPRELAINYHNALLPRYAGSHAVEWALHNREREHGVTWHVMETRVDAGDILKQRIFKISDEETVGSLHRKCFIAGMRAFRELLPELRDGTYNRVPQDLAQRSFYRASQRPPLEVPRAD